MKSHLVVLIALLIPVVCVADYNLGPCVVGGGGGNGRMAGGAYRASCTIGQSSEVAEGVTISRSGYFGFWRAVEGANFLERMSLSILQVTSSWACIHWSPVANATLYELYKSTSPFFVVTGTPWITVDAPYTTWCFDEEFIGDPNTNYYFRGKARRVSGTSPPANPSNIVGEHDFDITLPTTGGSKPDKPLEPEMD